MAIPFISFGQNLKFSGGHNHSVYLCEDGRVYATGSNHSISGKGNGQLGTGDTLDRDTLSPVVTGEQGHPSGFLSNVIQVHAGSGDHTLALTSDGEVYAWGNNRRGMLGIGTNDSISLVPKRVVTGQQNHPSGYLSDVAQICTGNESSFALLKSGEIMEWGDGMADGGYRNYPDYKSFPIASNFVQIDAGDDFAIVLTKEGKMWGWGLNNNFQLNSMSWGYTTPKEIYDNSGIPLKDIAKIAVGDQHVLALSKDGTIWSWGGNWNGQLGLMTQYAKSEKIYKVINPANHNTALSNIVDISAGNSHSLALTSEGKLYKWGLTSEDNSNLNAYIPTCLYCGTKKVVSISTGDNWSIYKTDDDNFRGEGLNYNGQIGFSGTFTPPCQIAKSCNNYVGLSSDFELCSNDQNILKTHVFPDSTNKFTWFKNGNEIVNYHADSLVITQSGDLYSAIKITTNNPTKPGNYCNGLAPVFETTVNHQSLESYSSLVNCFSDNPSLDTTLAISGTGSYSWWDQQINGNQLYIGDSLSVSSVNSDSIFYVQDDKNYTEIVGYQVNDINSWTTTEDTLETSIHFNALSDFVLNEITIDKHSHLLSGPCSSGSQSNQIITVYIMDELNNILHSYAPVIGCTNYGDYQLPVNFNITKQDNLRLVISNPYGIKFRYSQQGADYSSIDTSQIIQLKYSGSLEDDSYGMFYDWKISYGSPCSRYPVTITDNCPPTISPEIKDTVYGQFDFDADHFISEFSDPDGDELSSITITTLPTKGTLQLNGQNLLAGQKVSRSDLNGLVYIPDMFQNGNDTIVWQASDGNYLSDDADFILNIIVDPTITFENLLELTLDEGDTTALTSWQINFSNYYTYNDSLEVKITSQSSHGYFAHIDDLSVPITTFTQKEAHSSKIKYVHDNTNTTLDSITFIVTNQADTIFDLVLPIVINPIDDITISNLVNLTTQEGDTTILTSSQMSFENYFNINDTLNIVITTPAKNGLFTFNSDYTTSITTFNQFNIDSLSISYIHNNGNNISDSIVFYVANQTDTLFDLILPITITPVDDDTAQLLLNSGLTTSQDTSYITSAMLNATDTDSEDSTLVYQVVSAPMNGHLELTTSPGDTAHSFTQADINNNHVVYVGDSSLASSDLFIFNITDGTNTLGNIEFSISKLISSTVNKILDQVKVYPNPTTSKIVVTGACETTLLTSDGQKLLTTKEHSIDLSGYPNGLYLLEVKISESNLVKQVKVLKQ